jgi:hypothetical protein
VTDSLGGSDDVSESLTLHSFAAEVESVERAVSNDADVDIYVRGNECRITVAYPEGYFAPEGDVE